MNVKIAAQTLSTSVAAAINFFSYLKTAGFENCVATTNFMQKMNDMFAVLNSKNKFGKAGKNQLKEKILQRLKCT